MMTSEVAQCRFIINTMFDRGVAGLDDSHRAIEPQPGTKSAGWIVGHLSVTGDFARKLCGRKSLAPSEWRALFNPGTLPSHDAATYPPMAALVAKAREIYVDLCDAALVADATALAAENPFTPGRAAYPTSGEFLRYMMTGHFAYHCGQLVTWRSAAGLGRIEKWI